MIYKFTQAVTLQPLLIPGPAIVGVVSGSSEGASYVHTAGGTAFEVLGTVEQIETMIYDQAGIATVAIVPIGG